MKTLALSTLVLAMSATSALSHATFEIKEVQKNSNTKMVLRVPHGCEGEATLKVRVEIPEGVIGVKPMPKADWTLETVIADYEGEYEYYGRTLTSGVKEVIWTGELLDGHYDEFVFRARFTDKFADEEVVYIPSIQECATGNQSWIEIPGEGQTRSDLKKPAPSVTVLPAGHQHH